MNLKEPKKEVDQLVAKILANKKYREELYFLQQTFGITQEKFIATWIFWDTAIRTYSNEVYTSEVLRLVMHAHNYVRDSWHDKRQKIVLGYLKSIKPKSICEIGFGTPQKYTRYFLGKSVKIFLGDFKESSLSFAKTLLQYWHAGWRKKIRLEIFNLNQDALPKKYDVYLFQDSLEHAADPTATLQKYVTSAPKGTHFIFSLPIEIQSPIPEHNILWKNEREVTNWLNASGLKIIRNKTIHMDRRIDLFSRSLHPKFREIVVLARKA